MIENCQHMQRVIDVPNELNVKSHVISLLGINHFTHKVILEGVRPRFVPNSSAIIYTLFELRKKMIGLCIRARQWRRIFT
jgi:uncharacterized membrane protein